MRRPTSCTTRPPDQSSILRFIEDNWNTGRIGNSSLDEKAGTLNNLSAFSDSAGRADGAVNKLFLDPGTGQPSKS